MTLTTCATPGCRTLVVKGRCKAHGDQRPDATKRGYGYAHKKTRVQVFSEEPTCALCGAPGQPSDVADHIVPRRPDGPPEQDERSNYRRVCRRCHNRRSISEHGAMQRSEA